MKKYEEGSLITGNVTGIEKYGIFVNLDNDYSGLIHISEISENFVRNINDYVNIGETIKAKILECDDDEHQAKLTIKDIDYRITRAKRTKIMETESGFSSLKELLPQWIDAKEKEISAKKV